MSALKNKNLDLDKREQNKSVVQRFITEAAENGYTGEEQQGSHEEKKSYVPILSAVSESKEAGNFAAQLERLESKLNEITGSEEPKYILFNAMEEAVREEVRATMNNTNICRCDKCYYDVCALVLNNMPPQYATSQEGILMKKAKTLLSIDILTKLSGEIFEAINTVKNKPGH
ncbi:MAG: late competence development ComFB family protein [Oscillospiraceae bacterium]|nr:late competence development ComFB family protein [Oscillospiraceae bacterium]